MAFTDHGGRPINLDRKLGSGGEADIYALSGLSDQVAKIYFTQSSERTAKLQAMVGSPPADPTGSQGHVSICWPKTLLFSHGGKSCAGFLMHRVDFSTNVPVLQLYNPQDRQKVAPGFTWGYLVRTASNIASVVEAVHACGYVVGDLNESNFLVSDRALVTLVDCDSMQVPKAGGGRFFRCTVGKSDFTPPELQGRDFSQVDRDPTHDNFALGVMMFHLLMEGVHPYAGVWQGAGDPPHLEERIRTGDCPYVGSGRVAPMPTALPFDVLPSPVKSLFVRCFQYGHKSPTTRPSPREWREALNALERSLSPCSANRRHLYPNHLQICPWCERTVYLGGFDPYPLTVQQKPLKAAAFSARQTAGPPTPPLVFQPPPPAKPASASTAPGIARGWAIVLGWIAGFVGFVLALAGGSATERMLPAVLPQVPVPSWLHACVVWWTVATAVLFGVMVHGLLSAKKRRAGLSAMLGAGLTVTLVILIGIATLPSIRSSPASNSPPPGETRLEGQIIGQIPPATSVPRWLHAMTDQRAISSDNYPPPEGFQIRDRCAGEGCGYQRPWRALKEVPLVATWDQPAAEPVYTVSNREIVTAMSGIWIVNQPAVLEVTEPINIAGVGLQPGDLIYVLMNLGEGFVRGYFHGRLANFSPDGPNGRVVTRKLGDDYYFSLWVQMKTSTGIVGWAKDAGYPTFDGQSPSAGAIPNVAPDAGREQDGLWDYEVNVFTDGKPTFLKIGSVNIPCAVSRDVQKIHTGFILRANEAQAIELVANDGGELLAKTFIRPGTAENPAPPQAPPAQAVAKPSFNCANATTATERIICRDGDLATMELAMVAAHDELLEKLPTAEKSVFLKEHLEWFKDWARTCDATTATGTEKDLKDCVGRYLSNRVVQLKQLVASNTTPTSEVYKIGNGVSAPTVLYKVEPDYPDEARKAKLEGKVLVQLVVDEHGLPQQIRVIRSLGMGFDEKAIEAVSKWRFRPGAKAGKPVPVSANIEVNFRLL
jgi:TonB family protein